MTTRSPALGLLVLLACGCAARPDPVPTGPDARFSILGTFPARGAVTAADLYPLTTGSWTHEHLAGGDAPAGVTKVHHAKETQRFGATIAVELGADRVEYRSRDGEGRVVMPATLDRPQAALTRFDPPLVIAPATLGAGERFRSAVGMRVLDARNPRKQKESGRAERSIQYVDDQSVRTPDGMFRAARIVVEFTADLRLADASTRSTLWVVPGRGVIAQEHEETVTVLGLSGTPKRERTVLRTGSDPHISY